MRIYFNMLYF